MFTKNQIAIRILLLVAKMFADDKWSKELDTLITHINVFRPTAEDAA